MICEGHIESPNAPKTTGEGYVDQGQVSFRDQLFRQKVPFGLGKLCRRDSKL